MGLVHLWRSYDKGSVPIGKALLTTMVEHDLNPTNAGWSVKDVKTYAYTLKQLRKLAFNIGKPDVPYGYLVKEGAEDSEGKISEDSDPDCDDMSIIAIGKLNLERLLAGSRRPAMWLIDYYSQSRKDYHEAILFLVVDEHSKKLYWYVFQYDTGRFDRGIDEIQEVRELW